MTDSSNTGTALITGASSGIGAVYADRLARAGYDLILVARSADKLQSLARRLTGVGRQVEVIAADLTQAADLSRVEQVLKTNADITVLVNNAGIGATTPLLASGIDAMQNMIALNVTAATRLAYAVAPAMVARGAGTIVNIASIAALAPEVLNGVYSGTKAFMLAFTQSLHHELSPRGIRVQAVLPGATATEFWSTAGVPVEHLPTGIVMSAEDLVDAALSGLRQGEAITIPSLPEQAQWDAFDQARRAMGPNLSRVQPAPRYGSA